MMISSISDLHIRSADDDAAKVLMDFFRHPLVKNSHIIFLLGDIFDLMCGDHPEYLERYNQIFQEIKTKCLSGVEIYYFEGNHDLHLEKVFQRLFKNEDMSNLKLINGSVTLNINNEKMLFTHGDEYDYDNDSYQTYKKYVTGNFIKFIANYIMPLKLLDYIGIKAANNSRKRGQKKFNEDLVRSKIRRGVELLNHGEQVIIGGHSHIKDEYKFNTSQLYFNNGFPLKDKVFLYFNGEKWVFENL